MKLTIKITKEVLKESMLCLGGNPMYGMNCAIACAVNKLMPYSWIYPGELAVYNSRADAGCANNPIAMIPLPHEATKFIREFDSYKQSPKKRLSMPELSFQIEVPDSVIESIGIEEAKEIISMSSTLELVEG